MQAANKRKGSFAKVRLLAKKVLKWAGYVFLFLILLLCAVLTAFTLGSQIRESKTRMEAAPATGRFIQTGEGELFIQEMGPSNGPAVLFVHGTGSWSEIWRETMDEMSASGFRTIAVDMPPFGYSKRPAGLRYTPKDQGKRLNALIDSLALKKVTFVGHSFGSRGVMEAVFEEPGRVEGLVLVDAALGLSAKPQKRSKVVDALFFFHPIRNAIVSTTLANTLLTKKLLSAMVSDPSDATPEKVAMMQGPWVVEGNVNDMGNWFEVFLAPQEFSPSADNGRYAALDIPTLLIWGEEDSITPLSQAEYLDALIPHSELKVMEGVGHIPLIEDRESFNRILTDFIESERVR